MSGRLQEVLRFCESHSAWLRETVETLVRLESPSDDKAAVDRCGAVLAERLARIGAEVTPSRQSACGNHLFARWSPANPESPESQRQILLLGHLDTVWPVGTLGRMPVREEEGRLYGPGIFDMKSGIAVSMLAIRALQEIAGLTSRVVMLWTTDEEVGSRSSRALIEDAARESRAVLVLEPSLPGGGVKTSRKGVGEFELVVRGVSAHAGLDPGKGVSAIHELARQILALETLQDPSHGVTVNVGVVAGGSRPNVIADLASAKIDVRVQTMDDGVRLERAIRALQPTRASIRFDITGSVERPPLERSPAVVRLYQQAREVAAALGKDLGEGAAGGGSDGNFTAALGVPTLDGLGPRGDGAHAADEHVLVDDLTWRAAFLAGLIKFA
jgi:glutamate carboxypeptidase